WLALLVAACGKPSHHNDDANTGSDDAMIDGAQCASARIVPEEERTAQPDRFGVRAAIAPPPLKDGGIILVDAPSVPPDATQTCNVLTQTGCNAGQKCTWIIDQATPSVGHIGCAPNGSVATGGACLSTMPPNGYDNCVKGNY